MLKDGTQLGRISAGLITLVLWLATAALGLVEILFMRGIVMRAYTRFMGDPSRQSYWTAVNLGMWATVILAILYVAFVIGSAEYHRSRVGQRSSWKLFGWTIAVELLILFLYFVI